MRNVHATALRLPILLPQRACSQHLLAQLGCQAARQHHNPVLVALGLAYHDHPTIKIHVLDPQAQAFHQPHAGAVQQAGQQGHIGRQRR